MCLRNPAVCYQLCESEITVADNQLSYRKYQFAHFKIYIMWGTKDLLCISCYSLPFISDNLFYFIPLKFCKFTVQNLFLFPQIVVSSLLNIYLLSVKSLQVTSSQYILIHTNCCKSSLQNTIFILPSSCSSVFKKERKKKFIFTISLEDFEIRPVFRKSLVYVCYFNFPPYWSAPYLY